MTEKKEQQSLLLSFYSTVLRHITNTWPEMQSNSPVAKRKGVVPPFCQNGIPILLHNVHRLFRNIPLDR